MALGGDDRPLGHVWEVPFCPDCGVTGKHRDSCECAPAGDPVVGGNYEEVVLLSDVLDALRGARLPSGALIPGEAWIAGIIEREFRS